jgi:hypothetical protein
LNFADLLFGFSIFYAFVALFFKFKNRISYGLVNISIPHIQTDHILHPPRLQEPSNYFKNRPWITEVAGLFFSPQGLICFFCTNLMNEKHDTVGFGLPRPRNNLKPWTSFRAKKHAGHFHPYLEVQ